MSDDFVSCLYECRNPAYRQDRYGFLHYGINVTANINDFYLSIINISLQLRQKSKH